MNNLTHEMLVDPLKHQCVRKVNKKIKKWHKYVVCNT